MKSTERDLAALQSQLLRSKAADIAEGATRVGVVRMAKADLGTVSSADAVRDVVLDVRNRLGASEPVVVALGAVMNDRPILVVATNQSARDGGIRAGDLVRTGAKVLGGGGGGKADVAQGGGTDPNALQDALQAVAAQVSGVAS